MRKLFLSLGLLISVFIASPAAAAKVDGTVSDPILYEDPDGVINQGDTVRFDVTTESVQFPVLGVTCHQGDVLVYQNKHYLKGIDLNQRYFTLNSDRWRENPGAATCDAELFSMNIRNGRYHLLDAVTFEVNA